MPGPQALRFWRNLVRHSSALTIKHHLFPDSSSPVLTPTLVMVSAHHMRVNWQNLGDPDTLRAPCIGGPWQDLPLA